MLLAETKLEASAFHFLDAVSEQVLDKYDEVHLRPARSLLLADF